MEVQVLSRPHLYGRLAQMVRALRLHRRCRGFESLSVHMKKLFPMILIVIIFLFSVIAMRNSNRPQELFPGYKKTDAKIAQTTFYLYVADSANKQSKGLSNISRINPNEGMIFIFPTRGNYQFWMKDMKFSLDFLFVDGTRIVDIKRNITSQSYPETIYGSRAYDKVIEVQAGDTDNIKVGNIVKMRAWEDSNLRPSRLRRDAL